MDMEKSTRNNNMINDEENLKNCTKCLSNAVIWILRFLIFAEICGFILALVFFSYVQIGYTRTFQGTLVKAHATLDQGKENY
jgi:hypothetical protein